MQEIEEFYVPMPKIFDFSTLSILVPVIVSALGLFLMSVEAMVFVQFKSLPENVRFYVSVVSAFCMAFGGEVGTVSNTVEIFRKYIRSIMSVKFEWDVVTKYDYYGLGISAASTLIAMFIASSTRPDNVTQWSQLFSEWLVIPLMIFAVGDVYSGMIELGLRIGTFELRMQNWIVMKREYEQDILYQKALTESNQKTKVMNQELLKCWCGASLNSFDDYHNHLELHKQEALKFGSPAIAKKHFEDNAIADAHFNLPTVSEIIEWRTQ